MTELDTKIGQLLQKCKDIKNNKGCGNRKLFKKEGTTKLPPNVRQSIIDRVTSNKQTYSSTPMPPNRNLRSSNARLSSCELSAIGKDSNNEINGELNGSSSKENAILSKEDDDDIFVKDNNAKSVSFSTRSIKALDLNEIDEEKTPNNVQQNKSLSRNYASRKKVNKSITLSHQLEDELLDEIGTSLIDKGAKTRNNVSNSNKKEINEKIKSHQSRNKSSIKEKTPNQKLDSSICKELSSNKYKTPQISNIENIVVERPLSKSKSSVKSNNLSNKRVASTSTKKQASPIVEQELQETQKLPKQRLMRSFGTNTSNPVTIVRNLSKTFEAAVLGHENDEENDVGIEKSFGCNVNEDNILQKQKNVTNIVERIKSFNSKSKLTSKSPRRKSIASLLARSATKEYNVEITQQTDPFLNESQEENDTDKGNVTNNKYESKAFRFDYSKCILPNNNLTDIVNETKNEKKKKAEKCYLKSNKNNKQQDASLNETLPSFTEYLPKRNQQKQKAEEPHWSYENQTYNSHLRNQKQQEQDQSRTSLRMTNNENGLEISNENIDTHLEDVDDILETIQSPTKSPHYPSTITLNENNSDDNHSDGLIEKVDVMDRNVLILSNVLVENKKLHTRLSATDFVDQQEYVLPIEENVVPESITLPKKRGRKPKNSTLSTNNNVSELPSESVTSQTNAMPKKRGRKPKLNKTTSQNTDTTTQEQQLLGIASTSQTEVTLQKKPGKKKKESKSLSESRLNSNRDESQNVTSGNVRRSGRERKQSERSHVGIIQAYSTRYLSGVEIINLSPSEKRKSQNKKKSSIASKTTLSSICSQSSSGLAFQTEPSVLIPQNCDDFNTMSEKLSSIQEIDEELNDAEMIDSIQSTSSAVNNSKLKSLAKEKMRVKSGRITKRSSTQKSLNSTINIVDKHNQSHTIKWFGSKIGVKGDSEVGICLENPVDNAAIGVIKLVPKKRKNKTATKTYSLYFLVLEGYGEVEVGGQKQLITANDYFIVPQGMPYAINNLSEIAELKLHFVRVAKTNN